MDYYTLYNKRLERQLIHPKIGVWYGSLEEAQEMLVSCLEYIGTIDTSLKDDFVIVSVKTGEEWKDIVPQDKA